jgi:hypothetical protein
MEAFWDVAPYILVEVDRHFRFAYCLRHSSGPAYKHVSCEGGCHVLIFVEGR